MTQYDINLRDYFRILRRRKGVVIVVPLLFSLSAFVLAILQAPRPLYRATAAVRVERVVNVAWLLQEMISFSPEGNLETQAALIKGFPVMSLAAKKLGFIPPETTAEEIRSSPAYLQAIQNLQRLVEVKRVEGTSLIEISATSPVPEEAAQVANSVAAAFQEDNFDTRTRQAREARRFIESQIAEVGTRLRQAEEALKTFRETNQIFLMPEEAKGVLNRLTALEGDYAGSKRALEETEAQLRQLKNGKNGDRPMALSPDGGDPTLSRLYTSFLDLTLQRDKLLLTLLPTHPQVKQLEAQIATLEQSLREALTARLQMLRGRVNEVQRNIARLKQEHASVPEGTLEMIRMERDVKINERMFSLLKEKYQEVLIKEKEQVAEVSLVRPAIPPSEPINTPQAAPKAGVGLVIGLSLGIVLAFVIEALDTSIGAIDEVESLLDTSVLGVIPHLDLKAELAEEQAGPVVLDEESTQKYAFLISLFFPQSRVVEAFRALRTNLLMSGLDRGFKTLMVTSAMPMEGKTTVAINLAIALAQLGKRTLLVEADLRKPFLHHAFGVRKEPGFTEVVIGSARLEEAILGFADLILGKAGAEGLIDRPGMENLFLLPSGQQPPNPAEFLSAQAVASFVGEVRQHYDYVVLDAAPILPVADPSILGSTVDGTLLVVRVGQVPRAALRRAKVLLEAAKARVLGVCLSGVRAEVSPDYAEIGYYQYRYRYGMREPRTVQRRWIGLAKPLLGQLRTVALSSLVLLGLGGGLWAWHKGHLQFPFLTTAQVLPEPPEHHVSGDAKPRAADPRPAMTGQSSSHPPTAVDDQPKAVDRPPELEQPVPLTAPTIPNEPKQRHKPKERNERQYTVQVHAFQSKANAHRAVAQYGERGLPAFSDPADRPEGIWWRVFIGRFDSRAEAEMFGRKLIQEQGLKEFIVVRTNGAGS